MSRMRLQKDLFPYIQGKDPETAFTKSGVRRMALSGIIPYTEVEGRKLYNLDDVDDLLDSSGKLQARIEAVQREESTGRRGKIKRIS